MMGAAAVPIGAGLTWLFIHEPVAPKLRRIDEDVDISRAAVNARYELKAKLGKGGFGDVFVAVDKSSGQLVAIKVLSVAAQPKEMIEAEAYAMRRIGRHPNVVGLRDVVWVMPDDQNAKGEVSSCANVKALTSSCLLLASSRLPVATSCLLPPSLTPSLPHSVPQSLVSLPPPSLPPSLPPLPPSSPDVQLLGGLKYQQIAITGMASHGPCRGWGAL